MCNDLDSQCGIGSSLTQGIGSISSINNNTDISVCANCGKEGSSENMNTCNKCKQVKYCNAVCKKKHRSKHKKQCERRVAELYDEKLFKEPPPLHEDCPICFLRMPSFQSGWRYMTCCGKKICSGCIHTGGVRKGLCPFCRTQSPKSVKEAAERNEKRVEAGDSHAIYSLGCCYGGGMYGFPRDMDKALELWHRAAELGDAMAYTNIGASYKNGEGVETDKKKAIQYFELAALGGDEEARYNLGNVEALAGNMDRAIKHYIIAVGCGSSGSLDIIKWSYSKGYATKEDYTKALQSYQTYLGEIKSDQRDEAAAIDDEYRYY